ncbi:ATP-binding protein [Hahella sp. NBU794]|uniref:ATP-binding protein n=1 Tax=Hahella sp. NBU794 TaxID=3422590 RepID=UPI003D6F4260
MESATLNFDVSSGLKSVLGSELITDDEVAIFELVKNSFDANAKRVDIYFDENKIVIADNGDGMSFDDIQNKWLFVAYSEKKQRKKGFRDDISDSHHYAGSKGIGRFSSDRLGKKINLQTRPENEIDKFVHSLTIDWNLFDVDHANHFEKINVIYEEKNSYSLPPEIPSIKKGTIITISETRKKWERDDILNIKTDLAKLINPFGAEIDKFKIVIHAPGEIENDSSAAKNFRDKGEAVPPNALVNGEIGNFIFSTLQEKTTYISVEVTPDGTQIESILTDRGEVIYHIKEPNPYSLLKNSGFSCKLFFLNHSAKLTFAKRMGVPSVRFGSVFLFRNGFRVYPIGEEGYDWFKIDHRKQQGYARFLGSRDVIGRLDVSGYDKQFNEASSRNTGLIENEAVIELQTCFREHCLKRLERYIVPVTFPDKEDKYTSDISRLLTDPGKARVASAVAKLVDSDDVQLITYNKKLVSLLDERSSQFESSLSSLRAIADKSKDNTLLDSIKEAEKKFEAIRRSEELARKEADTEREARKAAQLRAQEAEKTVQKVTTQLKEERKRNLFLTSISSLNTDAIDSLHHQVTIYAVDIQQKIENILQKISNNKEFPVNDTMSTLEQISLLNKKVLGISKFATKANFRLESEMINADLGHYVEQYITEISINNIFGSLSIEVNNDGKGFEQNFKPIDISIVVDNLISNSRKRQIKANLITFDITHPSKNNIHIMVSDNGRGFDSSIDDLDRIFEKGFSLTDGSGLGLYHVRHVLGEMNGTIEAVKVKENNGASFLIRISK